VTDSQRIDPERLAALLDGRLSDADAVALRQQLAAADDDMLSAYADAVVVARELDAANPGSVELAAKTTIPIDTARRRRSHRRWIVGAAAAAAAVATVIIWRPTRLADGYAPAQFAAAIPAGARGLEESAWSSTRGGDGLSARARAARVGALLIDLELDVARGYSTRDHLLAVVALLAASPGGSPVAASLRAIAADSVVRLTGPRLNELGRQAIAVVEPSPAIAGAYLEAARVAAAAGDTAFFSRYAPSVLSKLDVTPITDADIRALESLVAAQPRDPIELSAAATRLLRSIAQ
jgi:hypothetical protein